MDYLRNIWTMSDKPQTNTLDKSKFFVAVRLIQLFQNGQKAENSNLDSSATMRVPFFEGVTGVSIQPFEPVAAAAPTAIAPAPQPQPEPPKQQPMASPLSPGRPPVYPTSSAMSMPQVTTTLAVQDPYTMVPSEQSRYEALFPQYEVQKDGFVYGKEAVDLFSKSGLDNGTLRDIWNLVDDPIDNKLSKLEFAMAMHLIVCVSKKNLPVPPSLPLSLKALKNNEKNVPSSDSVSTMTAPPQTTQPQQQTMAPQPLMVATETQQLISPTMSYDTAGNQPHEGDNSNQNPSDKSVMGNNSVMSAPPSGNLSISDAFDDLNPVTAAAAGSSYLSNPSSEGFASNTQPPPLMNQASAPAPLASMNSIPAPQPEQQPQMNVDMSTAAMGMGVGMGMGAAMTMNQPVSENNSMENKPTLSYPPMTSLTTTVSAPAPVTQKDTASLGTNDEELTKMEAVLQKLRAENISLRAQMGQYTEEELEVRKQISVTISQIGVMSQEVAGLRVKVSDAKAALIEATIELKAKTEEKE